MCTERSEPDLYPSDRPPTASTRQDQHPRVPLHIRGKRDGISSVSLRTHKPQWCSRDPSILCGDFQLSIAPGFSEHRV